MFNIILEMLERKSSEKAAAGPSKQKLVIVDTPAPVVKQKSGCC